MALKLVWAQAPEMTFSGTLVSVTPFTKGIVDAITGEESKRKDQFMIKVLGTDPETKQPREAVFFVFRNQFSCGIVPFVGKDSAIEIELDLVSNEQSQFPKVIGIRYNESNLSAKGLSLTVAGKFEE